MNDLITFNSDTFGTVRTAQINGEPWFVSADVCKALELGNPSQAMTRLDADEKDIISTDTPGGKQSMNAVNEFGLYALVLGSRKPEAKQFKRWITHEVIPAIRKHGTYMTPETLEAALLNPDNLIKILTALKTERDKSALLEKEVTLNKQIIGELKPKADYVDTILKNPGLVTITQISKDYGMSGYAMNKLLKESGVQYKQSEQWLLYSKYQAQGYTHSKTVNITRSDGRPDIKMETKFTQKGRLFIYNLLKKKGIVPLIERI